ncbi:MAG: phosphoribosyltransferase domain-containing protein [Staphylococcus sp.]|nr:phosphoribosyltransferase domain-containing protein [Staphylococcus sp.]
MIHERVMAVGHPIERATSLYYYYRENKYARLVHDTKYRGRPIVGETLTKTYAEELQKIGFFSGIDAIVPVPLHFLKEFHRGYNQAERLAHAISEKTGIEVINALKAKFHKSQTRKSAHARLVNTIDVYSADSGIDLNGKHILLVDDVITTGSTLLSCIKAIHSASPTARISIYSLAITQQS